MAINVIFTAENRKNMHVRFAINVIQTAKKRKYMHIELTSCSSWTRKNTFGVIKYFTKQITPSYLSKSEYSIEVLIKYKYLIYSTALGKLATRDVFENDTIENGAYFYRVTVFCQTAPILPSFYRATVFWSNRALT